MTAIIQQPEDCQPFNFNGLPIPRDWSEKNYRLTARRFASGAIEVVTRAVRAMTESGWEESRLAPRKPRKEVEADLTPDELETRARSRAEDNLDRAVRRAKQSVRWAVHQIQADHLLTLGYRENMTDGSQLRADWQRFCRIIRKGLPACGQYRAHPGLKDWAYVCCREQQQRGAWHFHVAVRGRQDITFIRRAWYATLGAPQDARGADTPGQVDVQGPQRRWGKETNEWRGNKLAGYMTKYLHKSFAELQDAKGTRRYWVSKGIEPPIEEKVWLASANFPAAIQCTHDFVRANGGGGIFTLWASQSWDVVWCCG